MFLYAVSSIRQLRYNVSSFFAPSSQTTEPIFQERRFWKSIQSFQGLRQALFFVIFCNAYNSENFEPIFKNYFSWKTEVWLSKQTDLVQWFEAKTRKKCEKMSRNWRWNYLLHNVVYIKIKYCGSSRFTNFKFGLKNWR